MTLTPHDYSTPFLKHQKPHKHPIPWPNDVVELAAKRQRLAVNQVCCICLMEIKVQIYKNSGVCSEDHRKDRDQDHEPFKAVGLKIHEGEDK